MMIGKLILTVTLMGVLSPVASAQLTPVKKFNVDSKATKDPSCEARTWERSNTVGQFIDSKHFAVLQTAKPCGRETWNTAPNQLLIFSLDGQLISSSLEERSRFGPIPLPGGRFILGSFNAGPTVYDLQQKQLTALSCPGGKGCSAFLQRPSDGKGSQLTLCVVHDKEQECDIYDAQSLQKISQQTTQIDKQPGLGRPLNLPVNAPVTAKMDSSGNAWFSTGTAIVKERTDGTQTTLNNQTLGLKATDQCALFQPVGDRVLASCYGTRFYTDGDLDMLFGYSRFLLIDSKTMQVLDRLNRPAYTSAALSPDGKWVALLHGSEVQILAIN